MKSLILAITLVFLPIPARATAFDFTGTNGLAGHFTLDATALVITDQPGLGVLGVIAPQDRALHGTYGGYSFTGTAGLTSSHEDFIHNYISDFWIMRSVLEDVQGKDGQPRPTGLDIFILDSVVDPRSVVPTHIPPSGEGDDFIYNVFFSDGSIVRGDMMTLTDPPDGSPVSEPSSLALTIAGTLVLGVFYSFQKGKP